MATYKNLFIDQGSDFSFSVDQSIDLTDYTSRGQIRKSYTSTNATDFNIIVDVPNGKLDVSLTAAQTGALKAGRYVYDIEILTSDSPAIVTRILEGQVEVTPRVTVG
jgi:hypothetical protein